jgi:hypothetical protein
MKAKFFQGNTDFPFITLVLIYHTVHVLCTDIETKDTQTHVHGLCTLYTNIIRLHNCLFCLTARSLTARSLTARRLNAAVLLPEVSLPAVSLPAVSLPAVSLPEISLPEVSLPAVSLPEVSLTAVLLPKILYFLPSKNYTMQASSYFLISLFSNFTKYLSVSPQHYLFFSLQTASLFDFLDVSQSSHLLH